MSVQNYVLLSVWACILSAVYRPILQDATQGGIIAVLSQGMGANYIVWLSLIVATLMIKKDRFQVPPLVLAGNLICLVAPFATLGWIGASLLAFFILKSAPQKAPALLLWVTCLREPVTALCLKIFAGNILGVDALMTNGILILMGRSSLIQSNMVIAENGTPLLILTGCSVFTNLSFNTLLWLCLHVFYERAVTALSWAILILTIFLTLISNALRLALMTDSEEAYLFYHDGLGSHYFEWGLLGVILLLIIGGCRYGTFR